MRRHTHKIEGRVSHELRALVAQGGELSASLRALLMIGGAACGLDLTAVQEEIPDLISARLQPAVRAYLLVLVNGVGDAPRYMPTITPIDDDALEEEELLGDADGAGFDV